MMALSAEVELRLVEAALNVRLNAYAPYSSFLVGAAILADDEIYLGCNVENASYGLAICAERCAIATMVASGVQEIQAIAVASRGGVTPCGACRQVLHEFGDSFLVLLVDSNRPSADDAYRNMQRWEMSSLLPGAFRLDET